MAKPRPTRRTLFAAPLLLGAGPAFAAPRTKIVTVLGDSITAGYGLAARAAMPYQLQLALTKLGVPVQVRAAGVSGDTTAGGLARVDFSVRKDTDLVVVADGAEANSVALGRFSTEARARAHAEALQAAGFAAKAEALGETRSRYWLDLVAGPGFAGAGVVGSGVLGSASTGVFGFGAILTACSGVGRDDRTSRSRAAGGVNSGSAESR